MLQIDEVTFCNISYELLWALASIRLTNMNNAIKNSVAKYSRGLDDLLDSIYSIADIFSFGCTQRCTNKNCLEKICSARVSSTMV